MMDFSTPIRYVKGVGEKLSQNLSKLDIHTVEDILYYTPHSYLDRRSAMAIAQAIKVENSTTEQASPSHRYIFQGTVRDTWLVRTRRRPLTLFYALLQDTTGSCILQWFNQAFLTKTITKGTTLLAATLPSYSYFQDQLTFTVEEYEILSSTQPTQPQHFLGLIPLYKLTQGITQKRIRSILHTVLEELDQTQMEKKQSVFPEPLTQNYRTEKHLLSLREALHNIHFPETHEKKDQALATLKYIEQFQWLFAMAIKKAQRKKEKTQFIFPISNPLDQKIKSLFPFSLTSDQLQVMAQMRKDLTGPHPMNRLLQGDVGSGKTVVALYALLAAVAHKAQGALMAPTEILAQQHAHTIHALLQSSQTNGHVPGVLPAPDFWTSGLLDSLTPQRLNSSPPPTPIRYALLTSATPRKEKTLLYQKIASGEINLVIGTHALIEDKVRFHNLGVVVIDEQHRFGVAQRARLIEKETPAGKPHVLVMTATPIPRTMWLTLFGDLDVSTLRELPPGRKVPHTFVRPPSRFSQVCNFIQQKIAEGRQAYFVYPLIDPSDKLPLQSATEMFERLKTQIFPDLCIALLHGKTPPSEKTQIMEDFRSGKIHILVSTVVIEVGIDVPNATLMVVENGERYGLSQLHQLRGRIARSEHESYFIILSKHGRSTVDHPKPMVQDRKITLPSPTANRRLPTPPLLDSKTSRLLNSSTARLPDFPTAQSPACSTSRLPTSRLSDSSTPQPPASHFPSLPSPEAPAHTAERLAIIERYSDGFKIAEEDLRLRGPGELFGFRQSGLPEFRFIDLIQDQELIFQTYQDIQKMIQDREKFRMSVQKTLLNNVQRLFGPTLNLAQIG